MSKEAKLKSAREIAMDVLTKVEQHKSYSHLSLHQSLSAETLSRKDSALVTELVYGTIQRMNTIDYFLDRFVKGGVRKLQPWVRSLLRLSFYQLYYLERIPEHAAVNEAVTIAKKRGHRGVSGLVNGVLRSIIRNQNTLIISSENLTDIEQISLETSHPIWLIQRWVDAYGLEETRELARANNSSPNASVRVNSLRTSRAEMVENFRQAELRVEPSVLSDDGLIIDEAGNLVANELYEQGMYSIQDESSMLVAQALAAQEGMKVLDCCAAPGGKTTHIAEKMQNQGEVWANDLHAHRVKLVEQQAERLGLTNIRTIAKDARLLHEEFNSSEFDRILIDAPCTGFGVIRRKPEIKWTKQADDVEAMSEIQYDLLTKMAPLLKNGGFLVYSTCTIDPRENEQVVQKFLQTHPSFSLSPKLSARLQPNIIERSGIGEGMIQVMPHHFHTDGFFIALLFKANE